MEEAVSAGCEATVESLRRHLMKAYDSCVSVRLQVAEATSALQNIASQRLYTELAAGEVKGIDFESDHDEMIRVARAALVKVHARAKKDADA